MRSPGVVLAIIHQLFPEEKGNRHQALSERRNIVAIADEAHRSQYDFIDGFARHMRDALLPKLISGELRVKDAERFLKERGL